MIFFRKLETILFEPQKLSFMCLIDFEVFYFFHFSSCLGSQEGHGCIIISEQKLPQDLTLIMQGRNDTNLVRENGPGPTEFIDI